MPQPLAGMCRRRRLCTTPKHMDESTSCADLLRARRSPTSARAYNNEEVGRFATHLQSNWPWQFSMSYPPFHSRVNDDEGLARLSSIAASLPIQLRLLGVIPMGSLLRKNSLHLRCFTLVMHIQRGLRISDAQQKSDVTIVTCKSCIEP